MVSLSFMHAILNCSDTISNKVGGIRYPHNGASVFYAGTELIVRRLLVPTRIGRQAPTGPAALERSDEERAKSPRPQRTFAK